MAKSKKKKRTKKLKPQVKTEVKKKVPLKNKIKKEIQTQKKHIVGFKHKGWNVAVLLIAVLIAFLLQSFLAAKFNPEIVQANIIQAKSTAREAFKLSSEYNIVQTENLRKGHYISPGETDVKVFSFGLSSHNETVILKGIKLTKIGNVADEIFTKAVLYEGENAIAESTIHNGEFDFKKFTSVLQPNSYKEFIVKLNISEEVLPGVRFNFEIADPYDLVLLINENPVYSLDKYPIQGSYVTIVGWRG